MDVEILTSNNAYTISNGKLTFDSTRLNETRDAGEYYCVASNKFGSVRSEPSRVSFGSKDTCLIFADIRFIDIRCGRCSLCI